MSVTKAALKGAHSEHYGTMKKKRELIEVITHHNLSLYFPCSYRVSRNLTGRSRGACCSGSGVDVDAATG